MVKAAPDANGTQSVIQELFRNLHHRHASEDKTRQTPVDAALDLLLDRAVLLRAQEMMSKKGQDKSIDIIFRASICAMVSVLNLFLDLDLLYTWRKASMIVAKAQVHSSSQVRSIRKWVLDFVQEGTLLIHLYFYAWETALENEGILQ